MNGKEHDLAKFVVAICGQEIGTKKELLANAKKYPPNHTLMIGDAPGDQQAALATAPCFFRSTPAMKKPVGSGCAMKVASGSSLARFAGTYQDELLAEFDHAPTATTLRGRNRIAARTA